MNDQQGILFNPEVLRKFKQAYKEATDLERETFVFDGHELVTSFAKYMIEYVETRLKTDQADAVHNG